MAIGEALVALLKTSPSVTAIAETPGAIAVGTIDQSISTPHIRMSVLSTNTMEDLEGSGGMEMPTVDFDCAATSKTVANQLAKAVKDFIRNYTGSIGGHKIRAVIYDDCGDDVVPLGRGSQQFLYVTTLTFQVQYT